MSNVSKNRGPTRAIHRFGINTGVAPAATSTSAVLHRRPHPGQTIRVGHGADVRFLCDAPFELRVGVLEPGGQRRGCLTSDGRRRVAIELDAYGQVLLVGNCARILRSRSASSEIPNAGGNKMTVRATCAIIAVVQNLPNRNVEPPTPMVRNWVWTCDEVIFSAGSTPRMAAPASVNTAVYRIVVGFRPGSTQNGGPPIWPE